MLLAVAVCHATVSLVGVGASLFGGSKGLRFMVGRTIGDRCFACVGCVHSGCAYTHADRCAVCIAVGIREWLYGHASTCYWWGRTRQKDYVDGV